MNNDRTWFNENSGLFKGAKSDFESFIEILSKSIIAEVDDTIPELPLKDLIFRIYRDIRFSNDRTPYKTHLSAAWSRTGKKGPYACYFLSLQPGNSFVGGGLYHTEAQPLNLLRRNIDKNSRQIKSILAGGELAKEFFSVQADGNKQKAVQAFVERNKEDALKTAPKNYSKDHREIELLRLRSYTLGKRLSDEEVTGDDVVQTITRIFKNMEPFISYLNSVVMPDINAESSNGEDAVVSGDSDGN
ncbi:hypothetical protein DFP73DRAFT_536599 [Morchella snyderi]|nr:hypothetical protein DFP73DRAFT_536599 [Morchella snyderi]